MARAFAAWREGTSLRQELEEKKASAALKWLAGVLGKAFYSWQVGEGILMLPFFAKKVLAASSPELILTA